MSRKMTPEEFNQWSRLPHAVVRRCFWWAYGDVTKRTGRNRPGAFTRCSLDYEDLVAEGNLALLDAWDLYDEKRKTKGRRASFKTYAYRSIYNRVSRYVDSNMSQMTTREWRRAKGGDPVADARIAAGCMLFSDIGDTENHGPHLIDRRSDSPDVELEKSEWLTNCIEKLRRELGKRKTAILLRWAKGDNLKNIGRTLGITREWARVLISEWMVAASAILADREDDSFDK